VCTGPDFGKEKNPKSDFSDFSVFRFFFDCLDRSRQRSARWQVISRLREKGLSKGVLKKMIDLRDSLSDR
jgi:hypothetical protein